MSKSYLTQSWPRAFIIATDGAQTAVVTDTFYAMYDAPCDFNLPQEVISEVDPEISKSEVLGFVRQVMGVDHANAQGNHTMVDIQYTSGHSNLSEIIAEVERMQRVDNVSFNLHTKL